MASSNILFTQRDLNFRKFSIPILIHPDIRFLNLHFQTE